jgi:hypothetical protein
MRWGPAILFFILGTFFGPMLLGLFSGKKKAASGY